MNNPSRKTDRYLSDEQAIKSLACSVLLQTIKDWKRKKNINGHVTYPLRSNCEYCINNPFFQYWIDASGLDITLEDFKNYLYSI